MLTTGSADADLSSGAASAAGKPTGQEEAAVALDLLELGRRARSRRAEGVRRVGQIAPLLTDAVGFVERRPEGLALLLVDDVVGRILVFVPALLAAGKIAHGGERREPPRLLGRDVVARILVAELAPALRCLVGVAGPGCVGGCRRFGRWRKTFAGRRHDQRSAGLVDDRLLLLAAEAPGKLAKNRHFRALARSVGGGLDAARQTRRGKRRSGQSEGRECRLGQCQVPSRIPIARGSTPRTAGGASA